MSGVDRLARLLQEAAGERGRDQPRKQAHEDRYRRVDRQCQDCGRKFTSSAYTVSRGGGRHCSACNSVRAEEARRARVEADPGFRETPFPTGIPLYHLQEAPCVVTSTPAWVLPGGALLSLHSFIPPGIDSSTP